MKFIDMEKPTELIRTILRTKQSEMTATNDAQQMGGTDTYSERYIKMKFFGIKDNASDPDSQDHSAAKKTAPKKEDVPVEIWFDPKKPEHLKKLQDARDIAKDGEEIVRKIRATKGWGISRVNAEDIINKKI